MSWGFQPLLPASGANGVAIAAGDGDADGLGQAAADGAQIAAPDTVVAVGVGDSNIVGAQIAEAVAAAAGTGDASATATATCASLGITTDSLNPSDTRPTITLSNDNLTATKNTGSASHAISRSKNSFASGKRYFESRIDAMHATSGDELGVIGLASKTSSLDTYLGGNAGVQNVDYSVGFFPDGKVWQNFILVGEPTGLSASVGEWIGLAVDFDAGKAWVRDSAGWHGDPEAGTGNLIVFTPNLRLHAATQLYSVVTPGGPDQTTTNLGATAFAYAVPSGFSRWFPLTGGSIASAIGEAVVAEPEYVEAAGSASGIGAATATGAEIAYLRPDSDVATDGWTDEGGGTSNIFQSIDEAEINDTDYVQSPIIVSATVDLTVRLCEGPTTIAEWTHNDIGGSFVTANQELTTPQFEAIGNFDNLFVELDDNAGNVYRCQVGNPPSGVAQPVELHYRYKKAA